MKSKVSVEVALQENIRLPPEKTVTNKYEYRRVYVCMYKNIFVSIIIYHIMWMDLIYIGR